jgi:predicted nucleic acid-binding protein
LFPEEKDLEQALGILKKFDKLSFCDALNLVIMERRKIKKILSFDSDFDRFPGIERVY